MYKNEQILNDGNTSSDQLFNFNKNTERKNKSNIQKSNNFINKILNENEKEITVSICKNQILKKKKIFYLNNILTKI